MKTKMLNAIVATIVVLACGMYGCTKKSAIVPTSTTLTPGNVTATVNGISFSGAATTATVASGAISFLSIQSNPDEWIELTCKATTTGTYSLNTINGNGGLYYDYSKSPTVEYVTDSTHTGSITISKLDMTAKKMSGTFSYTAKQIVPVLGTATVSITNGTFTDLTWQ